MIKGKPSSVAHELEKDFLLFYLLSNYDREKIYRIEWDIIEEGLGDSDIKIWKTDYTIERIQVKTRPSRNRLWTLVNEEIKKGLLQLFLQSRDDKKRENHIAFSYSLILGRYISDLGTGNKLKELSKKKGKRDNSLLIEIAKDHLLEYFKEYLNKTQEKKIHKDELIPEIALFLTEVSVRSGYTEELIGEINSFIPEYEKIFTYLSSNHFLDKDLLDELFQLKKLDNEEYKHELKLRKRVYNELRILRSLSFLKTKEIMISLREYSIDQGNFQFVLPIEDPYEIALGTPFLVFKETNPQFSISELKVERKTSNLIYATMFIFSGNDLFLKELKNNFDSNNKFGKIEGYFVRPVDPGISMNIDCIDQMISFFDSDQFKWWN